MLVAALCELKSRLLSTPRRTRRKRSTPRPPREELAQRLAEYQRFKRAAGWLAERRAAAGRASSARRPAPYAPPRPAAPLVDEQPGRLAEAMLHLLEPPARVDTTTIRRRAVAMRPFVERFRLRRAPAGASSSTTRSRASSAAPRRPHSSPCSS